MDGIPEVLERLGPSLPDLGLPIGRRHEILCATAARLWRAAAGFRLVDPTACGPRPTTTWGS